MTIDGRYFQCTFIADCRYEKQDRRIAFAGYCTLYNFYMHPNKLRTRISQFLILPPFQRKGVGRLLYQRICKILREDENIGEITVEDGNEAFMALRTSVDSALLKSVIFVNEAKVIEPMIALPERDLLESLRKPLKWPMKHFIRVFNKVMGRSAKRPLTPE